MEKAVGLCTEELMQILERLDSLDVVKTANAGKYRKEAVVQISVR